MTSARNDNQAVPATLEAVKWGLRDRNLSQVARVTGISRQSVWSIANGLTANPSHKTVERLAAYLRGELD